MRGRSCEGVERTWFISLFRPLSLLGIAPSSSQRDHTWACSRGDGYEVWSSSGKSQSWPWRWDERRRYETWLLVSMSAPHKTRNKPSARAASALSPWCNEKGICVLTFLGHFGGSNWRKMERWGVWHLISRIRDHRRCGGELWIRDSYTWPICLKVVWLKMWVIVWLSLFWSIVIATSPPRTTNRPGDYFLFL